MKDWLTILCGNLMKLSNGTVLWTGVNTGAAMSN
jgi:hypothetical protein